MGVLEGQISAAVAPRRDHGTRGLHLLLITTVVMLGMPLVATSRAAEFDFRFDGRIIVPAQVNGVDSLSVIVDSGVGNRLLILHHKETGDELGLHYVRTVPGARGAGSGENRDLSVSEPVPISLPDLDLQPLTVAVLGEFRRESPLHNDGVLGGALFIPYTVKFDFDSYRVSVQPPGDFEAPNNWTELSLDFGKNLPILEAHVRVGEGDPVAVRLIVDTGGKGALVLVQDSVKGLVPGSKSIHSLAGTGLRGDVFARHDRIGQVLIGDQVLDDVICSYWTGEEAPILEEIGVDGAIGIGALYRFNMIFDYANRRMFIRPNRYSTDAFERNMAGLVIRPTPLGSVGVYHVDEGSEAEAKGIQKGDLLLEVEGRPVDQYSYLDLVEVFTQHGREVRVVIEGKSGRRALRLELRRRI